MSKTLIIPEKPSVAADIAKALGGFTKTGDFYESPFALIAGAVGHLVELHVPESDSSGKDLSTLPIIPSRFGLAPIEKTKDRFGLLKKLMMRPDVTEIVNACDAGREGELIFRLIYELANCRKPVKRMWLQSMTADSIRAANAALRPGFEFDDLGDAAKCRSEADWLIGINGTRGITQLRLAQTGVYETTPVGRVQTPTLAIVEHREEQIRRFVPRDFWEVQAMFGVQESSYVGKWFSPSAPKDAEVSEGESETVEGFRFFDKAQADAIVAKCLGVAPSSVQDVTVPTRKGAPRLFDLTSLQREANTRFKFSAKKTLDIAQALYEKHKVTTYPRTDSNALPEDYVEKSKDVLASLAGTEFASHADRVLKGGWVKPGKPIFDNSKITDHFAIIPTEVRPSGLDEAEAQIYDMVVRRFVAAFHPDAEYSKTTRISIISGESFKTTGTVLVSPGWLEVYGPKAAESKVGLCKYAPGEPVITKGVRAEGKKTVPPSRYTEATLLGAMEGAGKFVDDEAVRDAMKGRGLGTPATRANTIEGLLNDKTYKNGAPARKEPFMVREGKEQHLVPTGKGTALVKFLESNGMEFLASPSMTGEWEQKLGLVEGGKLRRDEFMSEIGTTTRAMLDVIKGKVASMPAVVQHELGVACPKCAAQMLVSERSFDCQAACGIKMRREICGRQLTESEGIEYFRDGCTKQLDGFVSPKSGNPFSAALKLNRDEWKADFAFQERAEGAPRTGNPSAPDIGAICPQRNCGGVVRDQGALYACDKGDFKLWKKLAGKNLTATQAVKLIKTGKHPKIAGFTSGQGKIFDAPLLMSVDGKVTFDFPKR